MTQPYPKRLIEVDLPIKRISAHSRREKSIRHGHISTLHIWWARRPLAACRAVICAALWPDPADPLCPQDFRDKASKLITDFAHAAVSNKAIGESCDHQTWIKWQSLTRNGGLDGRVQAHWNVLRFALLDFIADFANWDNSTLQEYLDTSRALTHAAHEALGGAPGSRPLVLDPFAGGGSIPLEAMRVGADAFASDVNPIPVLLNKVILEYIPRYGRHLAEEVREWGAWIKQEATEQLTHLYPKDPDGATTVAYLWARTVLSEAPSGDDLPVQVPLLRSLWLSKRKDNLRALRWVRDENGLVKTEVSEIELGGKKQKVRQPVLEIFSPKTLVEVGTGSARGGAAICPVIKQGSQAATATQMIGLGTAPLDDSQFRAAMFEQLGEHRLEAAVTTDICGKNDSHAVRLDNEAVEAIRKARLHRKVATTIFFESNGGMSRAEATTPEIRLAVAEPEIDIGHVETVLEALTDACYYLTVEGNRYHFSFKENLNKRYADRRANIKDTSITDCVRSEIRKVFAASNGIEPVFYPEKTSQIPDKPILTLVVLSPEQSLEDEKRTKSFIESVIREHGTSSRTYKSGLVFVVVQSSGPLSEDARRVLAWDEIQKELPGINVDTTQIAQLEDNIKKSRRDLRDSVWRSYNNIALLGKNNEIRFIDLGNMHSSAATSIIQFIVNELVHVDEIQSGISPNLLVRNWPPAFREWSTKAVRDAFFASPLFPRLLNPDAIKETIARGVSNGQLAYVGKTAGGKYLPFSFERTINTADIEISEEMFIVSKETAEAYRKDSTKPEGSAPTLFPAEVGDARDLPKPGTDETTTADTGKSRPQTSQQKSALTWAGKIPSQKWMNFYTKFLTKLGVTSDLTLTVKVECRPEGGLSPQKMEEIKNALRELGLDDRID